MFTVGQKVVCVNDRFEPELARFYINLPKKGVVYVIRDVVMGVDFYKNEPGEICVYLVGMKNPPSAKEPYPERGFRADRFRELITQSEHESIFEEQELSNAQ